MQKQTSVEKPESLEQVRERLREKRVGESVADEELAIVGREEASTHLLGSAAADLGVTVGVSLVPALLPVLAPFMGDARTWLGMGLGVLLTALLLGFWLLPRSYRHVRIAAAWTFLVYTVAALGQLVSVFVLLRQDSGVAGVDASQIALVGAAAALVTLQAAMLAHAHRRR